MTSNNTSKRLLPSQGALYTTTITVIVLAFLVVIEHAMGRIPWCTCGFGVWTSDAWGNDNSQLFADPYTTSHILHGIIFFWALRYLAPKLPMRYRFIIALLVEVGWELLENSSFIINRYRESTASLSYFGDSILNSTGDVLAALFGFWLAYRLPWKVTLMLSVAIETIMLLVYRDNLTLNVLMLLYPVEAIKSWQMLRGT